MIPIDEQEKQQLGDGQDNPGQAAGKALEAAKQVSQSTANAAAATVQAGVEGGQAAAGIAAGTAAGGPWGAVLSAAWAMRHTLFKVLVCICLVLLIIVILICSLPGIVLNSVFGLNGTPPVEGTTLETSYSELSSVVSAVIDAGYDKSLARVEEIIANGGYDYDLSMDALINYAQSSAGYDVAYILAAYSASLQQKDTSVEDMVQKLTAVGSDMFPVTYVVKEHENLVPASYVTYKPETVTVVTAIQPAGIVNGVPKYNYTTEQRTYYVQDETRESEVEITVAAYKAVTITVPIYLNGSIAGVEQKTYYQENGTKTLSPTTEIIRYAACTIHPFNNRVIARAFDINLSAEYPTFKITYGTAIQNMANALKMTLYGSLGTGSSVPLTDAELLELVGQQTCNDTRKHIITTALSLVGKVPYFWGGKSEPGWNDEWNTPKLVTAAGSSSTGTIRPFGLDCSGFTDWVYRTALGVSIQAGSWGQYTNSTPISESELLPGDLGFLMNAQGTTSHVLIFVGYTDEGKRQWVHSESGTGVHVSTPRYDSELVLRRPGNVDFSQDVGSDAYGEPLYSLQVDVTHYCACTRCCGPNAQGITASGKRVAEGMVAMSSHYPFGTQIMINGVMYTVEDRGGAGIENDISRVDIFVPDHNYALRLGRFKTTAYIYRLGR
ncbi:MAG: NlpC/P60 family protein [Faecousia sp.]